MIRIALAAALFGVLFTFTPPAKPHVRFVRILLADGPSLRFVRHDAGDVRLGEGAFFRGGAV